MYTYIADKINERIKESDLILIELLLKKKSVIYENRQMKSNN